MSTNVAQSTQVSERLSPDKLDVILDTLSTFGVTDASIQAPCMAQGERIGE